MRKCRANHRMTALATILLGMILSLVDGTGRAQTTVRVAEIVKSKVQSPVYGEIFREDFDAPLDVPRYFDYSETKGFTVEPGAGLSGGGAMRSTFEKGQVSGGSLKVVFGKNPFNRGIHIDKTFKDIYWRVYVKHETCWRGNPAKLGRAICFAGPDWSEGLIAHVWGGKGDVLCIDPASGIRDNRKVTTKYNDFDHLRWLGVENGKTSIFSPTESGRWVCVESHVRLNTPGKADGIVELWVDNKLEAARLNLDLHGTWDEYGINAVFLENYWNSGSVKRQSRWFDDFVVSTNPIGPIQTSGSPTIILTNANLTKSEMQISSNSAGDNIIWKSNKLDIREIKPTALNGRFTGFLLGKNSFTKGDYWIRLREVNATGDWQPWTEWHAPFRVSP